MPLSINLSTIKEMHIPLVTKDGINVVAETWFNCAYGIDITIMQEDYAGAAYTIYVYVIDVSGKSVKQFFDEYNEILLNDYAEQVKVKHKTFVSRIKHYLIDKEKRVDTYLMTVDKDHVESYELKVNTRTLKVGKVPVEAISVGVGYYSDSEGYWIPSMAIYSRFDDLFRDIDKAVVK